METHACHPHQCHLSCFQSINFSYEWRLYQLGKETTTVRTCFQSINFSYEWRQEFDDSFTYQQGVSNQLISPTSGDSECIPLLQAHSCHQSFQSINFSYEWRRKRLRLNGVLGYVSNQLISPTSGDRERYRAPRADNPVSNQLISPTSGDPRHRHFI